MTIVRSAGVATLVALMAAHRAVTQQRDPEARPFDQAAVEAARDYLLRSEDGKQPPLSEWLQ